jgi:hypothetical protein
VIRETPSDPAERPDLARVLAEQREALRAFEGSALAGIAAALSDAAESLARTARDLKEISPNRWMTSEQAAAYLGCTSAAAFERVVAKEGIPKHYLSNRLPRYNRAELDAWLAGR